MTGKATKTTELRVTTDNQLGAMAKISLPLKQHKINIECFCGYEMQDQAVFMLTTSDNTKARTLLTNAGFMVTENPVVLWTTNNNPGEIYNATSALAEARVNTNYSYSTTVQNGKTATVVFATTDANRTLELLNRL